jgi:hypothetical protein
LQLFFAGGARLAAVNGMVTADKGGFTPGKTQREQLKSQLNSDRMSDFIAIYTAGSDVNYELGGHQARLSYKRDFLQYMRYTSQKAAAPF